MLSMWSSPIHALYVAFQPIFLTSKFSYLPFFQTTHNSETSTTKGTRILIATHKDRSKQSSEFTACVLLGFVVPLANAQLHVQKSWAKIILLSQTGMF
jgi:hypothetical protein